MAPSSWRDLCGALDVRNTDDWPIGNKAASTSASLFICSDLHICTNNFQRKWRAKAAHWAASNLLFGDLRPLVPPESSHSPEPTTCSRLWSMILWLFAKQNAKQTQQWTNSQNLTWSSFMLSSTCFSSSSGSDWVFATYLCIRRINNCVYLFLTYFSLWWQTANDHESLMIPVPKSQLQSVVPQAWRKHPCRSCNAQCFSLFSDFSASIAPNT